MSYKNLPEGYTLSKQINLQTDIKLMLLINGLAALIMIVMIVAAVLFVPFSFVIDGRTLVTMLIFVVAIVAYMVAHELVHGIFFKRFSGEKPKYGFTGMYAYAHCDYYFGKKEYLIIGLAPIVLFFFVFTALIFILPRELFWFVYLLQVFNISGGAGDLYVTNLLRKYPADTLIHDTGVGMEMYVPCSTLSNLKLHD
jgi:fatty acid desaturase